MRPTVFLTIAALATCVTTPSLAARRTRAEDDGDRKSFEPHADTIETRIDARVRAARRIVEERALLLSHADAQVLLQRFDAKLATLDAQVARALAAGEVTCEEAAAVRAATSRHRISARELVTRVSSPRR